MTSDVTMQAQEQEERAKQPATGPLPDVYLKRSKTVLDFATVLGVIFAIGLIFTAIYMGESDANFLNAPALLIVLFGTMAATSISFTVPELAKSGKIIAKSVIRRVYEPQELSRALISLSIIARKKGVLALSKYEDEMRKDPFLHRAMQMAIDGYGAEDIQRLLGQEIESLIERHRRSASITQRASEIAPAMGLIGTLVGLVQMLAELENPEAIGPAMAVALLTTFYGAILGTVIMAPLAIKLEKNSADETLVKTLVMIAAVSIANQENPRRLEMLLNAELPPDDRINYFET